MSARRLPRLATLVVLLAPAVPLGAAPLPQGAEAPAQREEDEEAPEDPLGRGSPRGAVQGFLQAARERDFERAARYLDLSPVPAGERGARGPALARQLKQVLDRVLWVELDRMSSSGEGDPEDMKDADRERLVGTTPPDAPEVAFFLSRGAREPGTDDTPIWRVAPSTVARIPEYYEDFGPGVVGELFPHSLIETAFLEIYLWQWIALVLLVLGAYLAGWAVAAILGRVLRPIVQRSPSTLDDQLVDLLVGPLRLLAAVGVFAGALPLLSLTVPAESFFHGATKVLVVVAMTWLVFRAIDVLAGFTRSRLTGRGQAQATYLIPIGSKALKLALSVLVALSALDTFGFDVTALLAGLGVGGLAVALALRPTLENVFGGIAVLVDEPVQPGQFCRFGDRVGTVEEVGLRSTRVRTLDRTVITVPNSEFSNMQIENYAKRDRMLLETTLGLRYETSAEQLRHVTVKLREMLRAHPKVLPDPFRVRFVGFGAYSLDLEVFCYVDTPDIGEFLAVKEDLLLRTIDVVEASGTCFAFPSSTTYLARDGGLDGQRARAAEDEVRAWREQGELPFPEHDQARLAALAGTLDWPPHGSPTARSAKR
jgi:MscS family membrane protein